MDWKQVESSNISAMAHEGTTMGVTFNSGTTYLYDNVGRETFDEIISADSVGGKFNSIVKKNPGKFPYRRI